MTSLRAPDLIAADINRQWRANGATDSLWMALVTKAIREEREAAQLRAVDALLSAPAETPAAAATPVVKKSGGWDWRVVEPAKRGPHQRGR